MVYLYFKVIVLHTIDAWYIKRDPREIKWFVWPNILFVKKKISWRNDPFEIKEKHNDLIVEIENLILRYLS